MFEGSLANSPAVATSVPTSPHAWLELWPQPRRSLVSNLFHGAVRAGASTPAAVVGAVVQDLHRRLRYARLPLDPTDATLQAVLEALEHASQDAQAYAESVLVWEALPADVRQQRKAERSQTFQREYMAQQPVTARQKLFLRHLGHTGPEPANRREASELINKLKEVSQ